MTTTLRLAFPLLTLALVLGGCSAETEVTSDESNLSSERGSAESPITPENFENHPNITPIAQKVAEIDGSQGEPTTCPMGVGMTQFYGVEAGSIRKVHRGGTTTGHDWSADEAYYDNAGKLLFVFHFDKTSSDMLHWTVKEQRTFFAGDGSILFDVIREGAFEIVGPPSGITPTKYDAYRLPQGDEAYSQTDLTEPKKLLEHLEEMLSGANVDCGRY